MTFLLTFLLLLMGGGTAGAGELAGPPDKRPAKERGKQILELKTCSYGIGGMDHTRTFVGIESKNINATPAKCTTTPIEVPADPCLAKMEAAMKAMEPFQILSWFKIENKFVATRHAITAQEHDKMVDAIDQWESAKKDCWSKP